MALAEGLWIRGVFTSIVCQPDVELEWRARQAGVPVHPIKMRGEWDLLATANIMYVMRKEHFEICHMHSFQAHAIGVIAAKVGRRLHTVLSRRVEESFIPPQTFSMSRYKYRWGVDRYIAVSDAVRSQLVADGLPEDKISVVHSGVDVRRFEGVDGSGVRRELNVGDDTVLLGCVSHFAKDRGLEDLIDAVPLILRDVPKLKLLLVGNGSLRSPLEARVADRGVQDAVLFAGHRKNVPEFLDAMDIVCQPSLKEGLGTSVLDAMACGKPVVAACAGGIPEVVEDGVSGLLVPPRDPEALAAAVVRLVKEEGLAEGLAACGRQKVEEEPFNVDAMVNGVRGIYEWLMEQGKVWG